MVILARKNRIKKMQRMRGWGLLLFFLIFFMGQALAQIDTVKFNRYYLKKYWTDTKAIATSPFRWNSSDWTKLGVFIVAESGLTMADQPVKDFFQDHRNKASTYISKHFLEGFGAEHSFIVMGSFFAYGVLAKNGKCKSTGLLALESFALATLVTRVPKSLVGRERPNNWRGDGPYTFNGPFGGNSFPSGHTTASFAVASVIATQFRDVKWIPITAYSIAGLAGVSRMYDNKHWLTDVIAGATVGTLVGNLVAHRTVNSHLTIVPFGNANFQGIKVVYSLK
jgi:Membrane-associated phospholipid phosphatase